MSANHASNSLSVVRLVAVCLYLALACPCSAASGSDRTIAQFEHTAWGPKDGAPRVIYAMAQSADGYLWLGGPEGLYRFDGVVFERYQPESGSPFPAHVVCSLFALPNGDLWIGFTNGISVLRNGHVTSYTTRDGLPGGVVRGFAQNREGTIWAVTGGGLARRKGERWERVAQDWNFPGSSPSAIFLDRDGTLWVKTEDTLVFLPPGTMRFRPTGIRVGQVPEITQVANGKLWIAEVTRSVRPIPLSDKRQPSDETEIQVGSAAVLFDKDGAMWVTTAGDGLRRSSAPEMLRGKIREFSTAVESFTARDGLSDDFARAIIQDREGNIWVGTNNGLDRFRKTGLVPVILPFKTAYAVLALGDAGDVWVATQGSIALVHGGRTDSGHLFAAEPYYAYRDPAGAIWWLCDNAMYRYVAGKFTRIERPPSFPKVYSHNGSGATEDGSGSLWLAAQFQGVFYRKNGNWHRLDSASEFGRLYCITAFTDWMGRAWFGFDDGTIIILADGKIQRTFPASESLVGGVKTINGRGSHIWTGGDEGLAYFDGGGFRRILPADAKAFGTVMGIEETADGSLWMAENRGVIQLPASEVRRALENPPHRVRYRVLDNFDGLPGTFAGAEINQKEVQGTDGRLWFLTSGGVVWIDPANIITNALPPPVLIESVRANGRQSASLTNLALPPRTDELQIDYTALSLSVPERVRFRYRLEGVDKDWQDAGTRRQAFYNTLGPGEYHFRVIACNNDGVWNETGAALTFRVSPAWYQTIWFRGLYGVVVLALIWVAYQVRVRQLQHQFAIGLEARVNERTRIARELHDTLLQTLHGLMFQFQAVRNLLPRRPDDAMRSLDEAISDTKTALTESRNAIQGLRSVPIAERNFSEILIAESRELARAENGDREPPKFQLTEEGERRTLSPTAQEEIQPIALEILRNAYRHAGAQRIEAEVRYGDQVLRVRIRDDGKGIDPDVLNAGGRAGHWGIRGVRERAGRIGAQVDFWSEVGTGTEVQVEVPASIAYEKVPRNEAWSRLFRRGKDRAELRKPDSDSYGG